MKRKGFCVLSIFSIFISVGEASKGLVAGLGLGNASAFTDKRVPINRDQLHQKISGRLFYLEVHNTTIVLDSTLRNYIDTKVAARDSGGKLVGCDALDMLDGIARFVNSITKLWQGFPRTFWISLGQTKEHTGDQFVFGILRDGSYVLYKKPFESLHAGAFVLTPF